MAADGTDDAATAAYADWLVGQGDDRARAAVDALRRASPLGHEVELPGPVGERNVYSLRPRGAIGVVADTPTALRIQLGAVLATGNHAVVARDAAAALPELPEAVTARLMLTDDVFA